MRNTHAIRIDVDGEYQYLSSYRVDQDKQGNYFVLGLGDLGAVIKSYNWMEATNLYVQGKLVFEKDCLSGVYRGKEVSGTVIFDSLCGCYVLYDGQKYYPVYMCKKLTFDKGEKNIEINQKNSVKNEGMSKTDAIIDKPMRFTIHTDGSCLSNPGGAGGYAGVILANGKEITRITGGEKDTTNNRMELMAAIKSLQALEKWKVQEVTLYSDSQYLVNPFSKGWLENWVNNNWKNTSGDVKNKELWQELLSLNNQYQVKWIWEKGHNGGKYNEICDQLAGESALQFR